VRAPPAVLLLTSVLAVPLHGQSDPSLRLEGRVAPVVAETVRAIADSVARVGLPVQPLYRKALEGGAKGVPPNRIIAAVNTVASQLALAAQALRSAKAPADPGAIEAGAYAINAGLSGGQVGELARAYRPPQSIAASLQSAGTLTALGVPAAQAVALVHQWMSAGRSPEQVMLLPQQLQAAMARGASPAQAASGIARGAPPGPPGASGGHPEPPPHAQDRSHKP
jgi:hypothetical protein